MMNLFSYRVEHDYGLAPNPFHNYCTLAVCKPSIRGNDNLSIGDWVVGTGSKSLENTNHLIYAMKVEEKLPFNKYWNDSRFQCKKPIINGSLVKMYGDNIYHQDISTKNWIQENSAHSLTSKQPNAKHLETDISGKYVLVSKEFYYFGENSPAIPDELIKVCNKGRNMQYKKIPLILRIKFIKWIEDNYQNGIHGDPVSWCNHL